MMAGDWNTLNTGDWGGVMISYDSGDTWKMTNFPPNYYVTSIVFLETLGSMLVAVRSNAFDKDEGGVWLSTDGGNSFKRTFSRPIYSMAYSPRAHTLFVSLANAADTVFASSDQGNTWQDASQGLDWGKNYIPGFSQIAVSPASNGAPPRIFLGTFLVNPTDSTDGSSALYTAVLPSTSTSTTGLVWELVKGMPCSLDPDNMPKDRLAVLPDPKEANLVYMAGNADCSSDSCKGGSCTTVFRIDWSKGNWTFASGRDTDTDTQPHPDCRALVWDSQADNLLLTQDGGVAVRTHPRTAGTGGWRGLAGTLGAMEYTSASYDGRLKRWIAGAQDNLVQLSEPSAPPSLAKGFLGCDGTRTEADNTNCPSRLIGGCQFGDGLTAWSQASPSAPTKSLPIPITMMFRDASAFPFFYPPWTLNSQKPEQLLLWVNGTAERPAGIWALNVPHVGDNDGADDDNLRESTPRVTANADADSNNVEEVARYNPAEPVARVTGFDLPKSVIECPPVYDLIAGGYTDGKSDPGLVIAMSATHLYQRRGSSSGQATSSPLPQSFAVPVVFPYKNGVPTVGPIAHGKTVSLAVSPADSEVIAVTGWPEDMEKGEEHVWYTANAGGKWQDITGNLVNATGTVARARPSGLLIMEYSEHNVHAILVGTVSGVYLAWSDQQGEWSRFGGMPRVKAQRLSYEAYSDVLICATYGRGVYTIEDAKAAVFAARPRSASKRHLKTVSPTAKFLPPQKQC